MATAVSVANFETAIGNCYDSISSGDYTAARKYYAMATAMNAGLLLEVGDEGSTVRRRNSLEGLKEAIDAAETAASNTSGDSRFVRTRLAFGGSV